MTNIELTIQFLKELFEQSTQSGCEYRVEHSFRVANIGKQIALKEDLDVEVAVIGCLLHDISYAQGFETDEQRDFHGKLSKEMALPFLNRLDLSEEQIQDIAIGIELHTTTEVDYAFDKKAIHDLIGDADNIDRFDAYRIYETLGYLKFDEMELEDKKEFIRNHIQKLTKYATMNFGSKTATQLWKEKIEFQLAFYEKMRLQFDSSEMIL